MGTTTKYADTTAPVATATAAARRSKDNRLTTITAAIQEAAAVERARAGCPAGELDNKATKEKKAQKHARFSASPAARASVESRVRMDVVRWDAPTRAKFAQMVACARYNLNGSADNALAEALALAHLHRRDARADVLPERELLRCSGVADTVPGTPDGAVVLAPGRMAATQVVRARAPRGARGVAALLRVTLAKVHRSLRWLIASGLGDGVCVFTIAVWVPRRLSRGAFAGFRAALAERAAWLDPRFEIALLAPPRDARASIFPPHFGALRGRDDERDDAAGDGAAADARIRGLVGDIRGFCDVWASGVAAPEDGDIGFLAEVL